MNFYPINEMTIPMWKQEIISILKRDLSEIKKKNPRYSLRAYSRKMGLGFGSLSDLINRKRDLSPQLGKKILERLTLEKDQQKRFVGLIERDEERKVFLLSQDAQCLIENWYYFAILNILQLEVAPKTAKDIAPRLGLSESKVKKGIKVLEGFGFLKRVDGGFVFTTNHWHTTDGIPSSSVRKAHLDGLKLAARAVEHLPVESRDVTSFVFNGNSHQMEKVRLEIRKFIQKINKIMSVGEADTVYKFNAQLFPIDRWLQKNNDLNK